MVVVVVVVVVVVEGLPELRKPEPDRLGAPERCLVFGLPESPGEPELVLGTVEPRLGPGVTGGNGVLQLHPGLVLRSGELGCWQVRVGQRLTG